MTAPMEANAVARCLQHERAVPTISVDRAVGGLQAWSLADSRRLLGDGEKRRRRIGTRPRAQRRG